MMREQRNEEKDMSLKHDYMKDDVRDDVLGVR